MLRSKSNAGLKMRMGLQNHMENAELLEMLNEEDEEMLLQMCGNYAG
jgi:hypothetical protein